MNNVFKEKEKTTMKKREENWNHLNVKRYLKSYDAQLSRINKNLGSGLTGEQHTALMILTQYRHNLHKSRESYETLEKDTKNSLRSFFLNQMNRLLKTASLPELNIRFFLIDHIDGDEMRTAYIDEINEQIEVYLDNIDKKYGTMYCPTGFRRMKRNNSHVLMEM